MSKKKNNNKKKKPKNKKNGTTALEGAPDETRRATSEMNEAEVASNKATEDFLAELDAEEEAKMAKMKKQVEKARKRAKKKAAKKKAEEEIASSCSNGENEQEEEEEKVDSNGDLDGRMELDDAVSVKLEEDKQVNDDETQSGVSMEVHEKGAAVPADESTAKIMVANDVVLANHVVGTTTKTASYVAKLHKDKAVLWNINQSLKRRIAEEKQKNGEEAAVNLRELYEYLGKREVASAFSKTFALRCKEKAILDVSRQSHAIRKEFEAIDDIPKFVAFTEAHPLLVKLKKISSKTEEETMEKLSELQLQLAAYKVWGNLLVHGGFPLGAEQDAVNELFCFLDGTLHGFSDDLRSFTGESMIKTVDALVLKKMEDVLKECRRCRKDGIHKGRYGVVLVSGVPNGSDLDRNTLEDSILCHFASEFDCEVTTVILMDGDKEICSQNALVGFFYRSDAFKAIQRKHVPFDQTCVLEIKPWRIELNQAPQVPLRRQC